MAESCPVCLSAAERGRDKDYGDKKQVICSRCGPFEISGSALAMLGSRVAQDPLTRARLSHAIRMNTSEANWSFVSSTNIDDLAQQPLPGIPKQLTHLAHWIAAQLKDDRLGRTPCPFPEMLAGVVGAADGGRVTKLINYAVEEEIVEFENDTLGLSPKGWAMAEPAPKRKRSKPKPTAATASLKIAKTHCNQCGGERNAYCRASHTVNGTDGETSWSNTYDVLECCGCNAVSVRHEFWFSEWDDFDEDPITGLPLRTPGVQITYWLPPTKRREPEWADNIDDHVLRLVIGEVYKALNAGLIVLASIGVRTLLDRAMFLRVGDPTGGFAGKLRNMVQNHCCPTGGLRGEPFDFVAFWHRVVDGAGEQGGEVAALEQVEVQETQDVLQ